MGTIAVETSELLSQMLKKEKIPHEVLNAKTMLEKRKSSQKRDSQDRLRSLRTWLVVVQISLTPKSRELGGLAVLGSERHESRRIDNQLRGRSGRQGDPGFSKFYVSLEDSLMVRFGGDKLKGLFEKMGDEQIESKTVTKSITMAQNV